MDYLEVEAAKQRTGLRLVLTEGVPGPWGEAAKAILHVKGLPFTPVRQVGGDANEALRDWTGFDNAPQAVYEDEPARAGFAEIVLLAERLAPTPPLLPRDPWERARVLGLLHELAGEMGFAWCRRLQLLHPFLEHATDATPEGIRRLGDKYGYSPEQAARADARVREIIELFGSVLREQRARGHDFFVGSTLSAVDLYWAPFAAMIEPLAPEQCPMSDYLRASYTLGPEQGRELVDPILLEHRDRIYREYLSLPLDF